MTILLRRPLTMQPQIGAARANVARSVGNGLFACVMPGLALRNLLQFDLNVSVATPAALAIKQSEIGVGAGSASNSALPEIFVGTTGSGGVAFEAAEWTGMTFFSPFPATSSAQYVFSYVKNSSLTGLQQSYVDNNRYSVAGTTTYTTYSIPGRTHFISRRSDGQVVGRLYGKNGGLIASGTSTYAESGVRLEIARYAAVNSCVFAALWRRRLSDAEIDGLARDPWSLLAHSRIAIPGGAASLPPHLTLSSGSLTQRPAPSSSDSKLYLASSGTLVARQSPQAGDRRVTLESTGLVAYTT